MCGGGLTDALVDLDSYGLVSWAGQPAGVDVGRLVDGGAVEGDGAAGQRSKHGT